MKHIRRIDEEDKKTPRHFYQLVQQLIHKAAPFWNIDIQVLKPNTRIAYVTDVLANAIADGNEFDDLDRAFFKQNEKEIRGQILKEII